MGPPGRVGCPKSQFYLDQTSLRASQIPVLDKGRVTFSAEMNQIWHGMEWSTFMHPEYTRQACCLVGEGIDMPCLWRN